MGCVLMVETEHQISVVAQKCHRHIDIISISLIKDVFSLSQLHWAEVLLLRKCRSEINYSPLNPNSTFFGLDERADPGQNLRPRQACAITACFGCTR